MEDKNSSRLWVYPPICRTKVGTPWSPSFPRQSLARRRARNIVQVHAHALNGSWECYPVVRVGLGAIWGDHGRRRSLHFTTPHFCPKKGWVYPLLSITLLLMYQGPTLHQSVYLEISPPHIQGVKMLVKCKHCQHSSWELRNCAFGEYTGCCDDRCCQRDQKRTLMPPVLAMMTRPLKHGQNFRISTPC